MYFDGQSGSLDHALVSSSLNAKITGANKWHINADEPIAKDYNQEFNLAYMYTPDAFRSSDHDPLLIGLNLKAPDSDGDGSIDAEDCAPLNKDIYPGAPEVCDGLDNNCDGQVDEGRDNFLLPGC
jgi:hypothetical protein